MCFRAKDGLCISNTADLLRFLSFMLSRFYTEWLKNNKISNDWQIYGEDTLLMRKIIGEWPDWFKKAGCQEGYGNSIKLSVHLWWA